MPKPPGNNVRASTIDNKKLTITLINFKPKLPTLLIREVARYHYASQWGLLRGILQRANQAVFILSLVVFLVVAIGVSLLADNCSSTQFTTFGWSLLLLPLVALNRLREAALQGLRKVVVAQMPEKLLQPAILLVLVVSASQVGGLTPPLAMAFYCVAATASFFVGTMLLFRALPEEVRSSNPCYDDPAWFSSVLPLSLLGGLQIINSQTDIFMLGLLATKEEVGFYRVAFSGAALVIFVLLAVNSVLAPYIARSYRAGDMLQLQRMVTMCGRLSLVAAFFVLSLFILLGRPIISVVYGVDFNDAYIPLVVLCIGQLFNASLGSSSLLLNMTGYERETLKCSLISAILNVTLNITLIPAFGVIGAAIATTVTLIIWRLTLSRMVKIRLDIECSPIILHQRKGVQK